MLSLTRRPGEDIIIGTDIRVRILAVQGRAVRVGISAPDGVSVHREEVYERILAEKGEKE